LAFRLVYDYTLGFALAGPPPPPSNALRQRSQTATARIPPLPAGQQLPHPGRVRHHAWADDREERFTSGLDTLICGLQAAQRSPESSHAS
jgi:Tetracyclin repressor, C-terminal all-alpha domain.